MRPFSTKTHQNAIDAQEMAEHTTPCPRFRTALYSAADHVHLRRSPDAVTA